MENRLQPWYTHTSASQSLTWAPRSQTCQEWAKTSDGGPGSPPPDAQRPGEGRSFTMQCRHHPTRGRRPLPRPGCSKAPANSRLVVSGERESCQLGLCVMIPDVLAEKEGPRPASEPSTLSNQGISRLCSKVMLIGNVTYKLFSISLWTDICFVCSVPSASPGALGSLSLVEIPSGTGWESQDRRTDGRTGVVWCGWGSGAWLRVRVSVDPMLWAQRPAQ